MPASPYVDAQSGGSAPNRRQVLRGAAIGTGAVVASGVLGRIPAAAYAEPARALGQRLAGKTAVVIGSGFGGAVAALRLGQAGIKVTVLERGRRWDVRPDGSTFCTITDPDWRCGWFEANPPLGLDGSRSIERRAGLIQKHTGDGINVLCGAGVGGGSLVIGMFLPQPRKSEWDPVYPFLSYELMDGTYWPRARQMLNAQTLPDDVLAAPQYKGARAWLEYIAEFRKTPVKIPFAIDFDVVRQELAGTRPRCHVIGEGPFGSNSGAKNSVDRNYLPKAEATGNVTVLALHEVTEIHKVQGEEKYEVRVKRIDIDGNVLETKAFVADFLFMAAGTLNTGKLLVSAKAKGHLPQLNDHVGKGFGNNGDFLVLRTTLRRDVGSAQGGPGNVKFFDDANPYAPASMAWEASPIPSWLPNSTAHLVTSVTPERGEIRYDAASGSGKVYWPYGNMATKGEKAARDLVTRVWWETEGKKGYLFNGLPDYDEGTAFGLGARNTWHPLGGMVMGSPGRGATDLDGKVQGCTGLYCVDGSVLPGSVCLANPSLTITANAERIMDRFIESWS